MSKGDAAYLLALAGLLRDGILADPVPDYPRSSLIHALDGVAYRLTWPRSRRPA